MAMGPEPEGICVATHQGALFKLPREIRDEIYSYLVKSSYILAFWTHPKFNADLSILRVSKAVSHEAIHVLYTESIFRSELNLYGRYIPYKQYSKEVTSCMMKLKYDILGFDAGSNWFEPERSAWENKKLVCEDTIDHFTGTDITRNYMHIRFWLTQMNVTTLTIPLTQTLKKLGGFRTVTVELCSDPLMIKAQLASEYMKEKMQAIEAHLESALGPAALECYGSPGTVDYHGYLTFHPHQYLVTKSESEMEGRASNG